MWKGKGPQDWETIELGTCRAEQVTELGCYEAQRVMGLRWGVTGLRRLWDGGSHRAKL